MVENPSYYSILPANVRYDKRLGKPNARELYSEITALSNKYGYCIARNAYFAELYGINEKTISKWISTLVECGYLYREIICYPNTKQVKERRLYPLSNPIVSGTPSPRKNGGGIPAKMTTPPHGKAKDNITSINKEREELSSSRQTEKLPLVAWPDSLGAMTGKIERLLLDVKQRGMSDKAIQKAIDLTKIAEPNTPYGYLKTILDDWLSQNIYTTHDWQALQKKKRDAKNREIPSIPIYKI